MLKKWTFLMMLIVVLVACGGGPGGGPSDSGNSGSGELADTLSVYNWADYIDEELLTKYQEEYGVEVIYDTYASNEDLLAKMQAGADGYDVIFPSDYMVSTMIELDMLAEIDTADLSNFGNLDSAFTNPPFDPNNQHCVAYQWGTTGIGYRNGNAFFDANPPDSWGYLFDPAILEQYAGDGINVLNDSRELPAAAAFYLGFSPNTTNPDEIAQIQQTILDAKPFWKTFNSDGYDTELLIPDEVAMTHGWSGDVALAYYETYDEETEDGNWYYSIPNEGAVKWLDNICITKASEKYDTALHFMNYLLDAENGAAITNYTYYASPNTAAKEFIEADVLEDPSIFPPDDVFNKLEWLVDVGDDTQLYDEMWTAVKAGQ